MLWIDPLVQSLHFFSGLMTFSNSRLILIIPDWAKSSSVSRVKFRKKRTVWWVKFLLIYLLYTFRKYVTQTYWSKIFKLFPVVICKYWYCGCSFWIFRIFSVGYPLFIIFARWISLPSAEFITIFAKFLSVLMVFFSIQRMYDLVESLIKEFH